MFKKELSIELSEFINQAEQELIEQIIRKRGKRHHDIDRYTETCVINPDVKITDKKSLLDIISKVAEIINNCELNFNKTNPIYSVKTERNQKYSLIEWTSINHAFDLDAQKIVPKRKTQQLERTNISTFSVKVNYQN